MMISAATPRRQERLDRRFRNARLIAVAGHVQRAHSRRSPSRTEAIRAGLNDERHIRETSSKLRRMVDLPRVVRDTNPRPDRAATSACPARPSDPDGEPRRALFATRKKLLRRGGWQVVGEGLAFVGSSFLYGLDGLLGGFLGDLFASLEGFLSRFFCLLLDVVG